MKFCVSNTLAAASVIALLAGAAGAPALAASDSGQQVKTGQTMDRSADKMKVGQTKSGENNYKDDNMTATDPTDPVRQRSMAMRDSECLSGFTDAQARYNDMPMTTRNDFRTLYRAAETFAINGNEEACRDVVAGMEELREQRRDRMEKADRRDMDMRSVERMETAVPAAELRGSVRASEVIGMSVRNMRDEGLGDVEDVVLKPDGSIRFVLIGQGGFLGLGEDWVAVPWERLRIARDFDYAYLPISEEAFEDAPTVNDEMLRDSDARGVPADIDRFYDENVQERG